MGDLDGFGDNAKKAQEPPEPPPSTKGEQQFAKVAPYLYGSLFLAAIAWWQWPTIVAFVHNNLPN